MMTESPRDCWRTPKALFDKLHQEFDFTVDGAADDTNHLLPVYCSADGVSLLDTYPPADERVFVNPPFSRCADFTRWAAMQQCLVVMLLPGHRHEQAWWHDYVLPFADQIRFIRGRVAYNPPPGVESSSASFPSVILVYNLPSDHPHTNGPSIESWGYR